MLYCKRVPALRAASLCHVRRLRVRRIGIMRNHRLLGEAVAPEKMVRGERKQACPGRRRAGTKGRYTMDECVMCKRNVQQAENWIKCVRHEVA